MKKELKKLGIGIQKVRGEVVKPKKLVKQVKKNEIRYDLVFKLSKQNQLERKLIKGILDLTMGMFCDKMSSKEFKSIKAKYYE